MTQKPLSSATVMAVMLLILVWTLMRKTYMQDSADNNEIIESATLTEFNETTLKDCQEDSFVVRDKVAVILETRPQINLAPLILHFASVLGPTWPVLIYTSANVVEVWASTPSLQKWSKQIQVRALQEGTSIQNHDAVSDFLTQSWIWEDLAPAKHVLLFQPDSIICANAPQSADDFLEYDFIGAPVAEAYGQGYNGGLSIRNRETVLELIRTHDWRAEQTEPFSKFEDQWMVRKIRDLPGSRLPSTEVAMQFSVETTYYERPLGYHQIGRWHPEKMAEVAKWCPEVALAGGAAFV